MDGNSNNSSPMTQTTRKRHDKFGTERLGEVASHRTIGASGDAWRALAGFRGSAGCSVQARATAALRASAGPDRGSG